METADIKCINHKSDFPAVIHLTDAAGNRVPFPDCDWSAEFWTGNRMHTYAVSYRGGVYVNCRKTDDGDGILVIFKGHGMGTGPLHWEPHFYFPNDMFPGGIQDIYRPEPLDIVLVPGKGDCPTTAEVESMLPYIKGKDFTYADFTPEQIAELQRPATEAAAKVDALQPDRFVTSDLLSRKLGPLWPTTQSIIDNVINTNGIYVATGSFIDLISPANYRPGNIKIGDIVRFEVLPEVLMKCEELNFSLAGIETKVTEVRPLGANRTICRLRGTTYLDGEEYSLSFFLNADAKKCYIEISAAPASPHDIDTVLKYDVLPKFGDAFVYQSYNLFVLYAGHHLSGSPEGYDVFNGYYCDNYYEIIGLCGEANSVDIFQLRFTGNAREILGDGSVSDEETSVQVDAFADSLWYRDANGFYGYAAVTQNTDSPTDFDEYTEGDLESARNLCVTKVEFTSYDGRNYPEKTYDYIKSNNDGTKTFYWEFGDFVYTRTATLP